VVAPPGMTEAAAIAWRKFRSQMDELKPADKPALIVLANAWAEMEDAQTHIDEQGTVVTLPNGYPNPNPYCKIRDKARAAVTQMMRQFGLTPASRDFDRKAKEEPTKATGLPKF